MIQFIDHLEHPQRIMESNSRCACKLHNEISSDSAVAVFNIIRSKKVSQYIRQALVTNEIISTNSSCICKDGLEHYQTVYSNPKSSSSKKISFAF